MDKAPAAVIDRVLRAYVLMRTLTTDAIARAREQVTGYLDMLVSAGESDMDRLTFCGISYLRELEARNRPDRRGYTGM